MNVFYKKMFTELRAMVRIRVRSLLFEKNRKEYKIRVKAGPSALFNIFRYMQIDIAKLLYINVWRHVSRKLET